MTKAVWSHIWRLLVMQFLKSAIYFILKKSVTEVYFLLNDEANLEQNELQYSCG